MSKIMSIVFLFLSPVMLKGEGDDAFPLRPGVVFNHRIESMDDIWATDLLHGSSIEQMSVIRRWSSPGTVTGFGNGWVDQNVISLEKIEEEVFALTQGGQSVLIVDQALANSATATLQSREGGWLLTTTEGRSYDFDSRGRLVLMTQGSGRVGYHYDQAGRLKRVSQSPDNQLVYIYDDAGWIRRITGPEGLSVHYEYNSDGQLISVTNPWNHRITYSYGSEGELVSATDSLRNQKTIPRNVPASPSMMAPVVPDESTELSYSLVDSRRKQYDQSGRLVSKNWRGYTTTYRHDDIGRPVEVISPQGITTVRYDQFGRVAGITAPDGVQHNWTYNQLDLPIRISNSQGDWIASEYDNHGRLIRESRSQGDWKEYDFDPYGRVATKRSSPGQGQTYRYDSADRVVQIRFFNGPEVNYEYTALGMLQSEKWSTGEQKQWDYDARGQLQSAVINGLTTTYRYDEARRLIEISDPIHGAKQFIYPANEQEPCVMTWGRNGTWAIQKTAYHKPAREQFRSNEQTAETAYFYDNHGHLTTIRTPGERYWSYRYDQAGRQEGIEYPGGQQLQYVYNAAGKFSRIVRDERTWRDYLYDERGLLKLESSAAGITAVYAYDEVGRLAQIMGPDGAATLQYDEHGNVRLMEGREFTVQQTFHDDGTLKTRSYAPAGLDFQFPLDDMGRPAGVVLNEVNVTYEYGEHGRICLILLPGGRSIGILHDSGGRATRYDFGEQVSLEIEYDQRDRITSLLAHSEAAPILLEEQYVYDSGENLTKIVQAGQEVESFQYDPDHRLLSSAASGETVRYIYDANDNPVAVGPGDQQVRWKLDRGGRPLSDNRETTFQWDQGGNLTELDSFHLTTRNQFDSADRLVNRQVGAHAWEFGYLPGGDRLWSESPTGRCWYAYQREGLIGWKEETGIDWLVISDPVTQHPLALCSSAGNLLYLIADHLGSIRRVVDEKGNLVSLSDYGPFGVVRRHEGYCPLQMYAGMIREDHGLYYARQRYYDPAILRFVSLDPSTGSSDFPASHNGYAYAANNPLRFRDPSGTSPEFVFKRYYEYYDVRDFNDHELWLHLLDLYEQKEEWIKQGLSLGELRFDGDIKQAEDHLYRRQLIDMSDWDQAEIEAWNQRVPYHERYRASQIEEHKAQTGVYGKPVDPGADVTGATPRKPVDSARISDTHDSKRNTQRLADGEVVEEVDKTRNLNQGNKAENPASAGSADEQAVSQPMKKGDGQGNVQTATPLNPSGHKEDDVSLEEKNRNKRFFHRDKDGKLEEIIDPKASDIGVDKSGAPRPRPGSGNSIIETDPEGKVTQIHIDDKFVNSGEKKRLQDKILGKQHEGVPPAKPRPASAGGGLVTYDGDDIDGVPDWLLGKKKTSASSPDNQPGLGLQLLDDFDERPKGSSTGLGDRILPDELIPDKSRPYVDTPDWNNPSRIARRTAREVAEETAARLRRGLTGLTRTLLAGGIVGAAWNVYSSYNDAQDLYDAGSFIHEEWDRERRIRSLNRQQTQIWLANDDLARRLRKLLKQDLERQNDPNRRADIFRYPDGSLPTINELDDLVRRNLTRGTPALTGVLAPRGASIARAPFDVDLARRLLRQIQEVTESLLNDQQTINKLLTNAEKMLLVADAATNHRPEDFLSLERKTRQLEQLLNSYQDDVAAEKKRIDQLAAKMWIHATAVCEESSHATDDDASDDLVKETYKKNKGTVEDLLNSRRDLSDGSKLQGKIADIHRLANEVRTQAALLNSYAKFQPGEGDRYEDSLQAINDQMNLAQDLAESPLVAEKKQRLNRLTSQFLEMVRPWVILPDASSLLDEYQQFKQNSGERATRSDRRFQDQKLISVWMELQRKLKAYPENAAQIIQHAKQVSTEEFNKFTSQFRNSLPPYSDLVTSEENLDAATRQLRSCWHSIEQADLDRRLQLPPTPDLFRALAPTNFREPLAALPEPRIPLVKRPDHPFDREIVHLNDPRRARHGEEIVFDFNNAGAPRGVSREINQAMNQPTGKTAEPRHQATGANSSLVEIPNLSGLSAANAKQLVEAKGLQLTVSLGNPAPDSAQTYHVMQQAPNAGTRVARGQSVRVIIYNQPESDPPVMVAQTERKPARPADSTPKSGEEQIVVPQVIGMTSSEAAHLIAHKGLRVKYLKGKAAFRKEQEAIIYAQSPPAIRRVDPGTEVTITYYDSAEPLKIRVPTLVGLASTEAESRLKAIGLRSRITVTGNPPNTQLENQVHAQSPRENTLLPEQGLVTLSIYGKVAPQPRPMARATATGQWQCSCGAIWILKQNGNQITGQEVSNKEGWTRNLSGTLQGNRLSFRWSGSDPKQTGGIGGSGVAVFDAGFTIAGWNMTNTQGNTWSGNLKKTP